MRQGIENHVVNHAMEMSVISENMSWARQQFAGFFLPGLFPFKASLSLCLELMSSIAAEWQASICPFYEERVSTRKESSDVCIPVSQYEGRSGARTYVPGTGWSCSSEKPVCLSLSHVWGSDNFPFAFVMPPADIYIDIWHLYSTQFINGLLCRLYVEY